MHNHYKPVRFVVGCKIAFAKLRSRKVLNPDNVGHMAPLLLSQGSTKLTVQALFGLGCGPMYSQHAQRSNSDSGESCKKQSLVNLSKDNASHPRHGVHVDLHYARNLSRFRKRQGELTAGGNSVKNSANAELVTHVQSGGDDTGGEKINVSCRSNMCRLEIGNSTRCQCLHDVRNFRVFELVEVFRERVGHPDIVDLQSGRRE